MAICVLQKFIQSPLNSSFEQNINGRQVIEVPVHLDDVGVVQEQLDFHFPNELLHEVVGDNLLLFEHFHRADETRCLLFYQQHFAEFPFPQLLYQKEVFQAHFSLLCSTDLRWRAYTKSLSLLSKVLGI
jgi:hypothetical protein